MSNIFLKRVNNEIQNFNEKKNYYKYNKNIQNFFNELNIITYIENNNDTFLDGYR